MIVHVKFELTINKLKLRIKKQDSGLGLRDSVDVYNKFIMKIHVQHTPNDIDAQDTNLFF